MFFAAWSIGCGQVVEEAPSQAPSNRYVQQQSLRARMEAAAPPRLYQRQCFPEQSGFTPSPDGVRFPAESESDGGLLLAWPGPGCGYPEQAALALTAAGHIPVHMLAASWLHPTECDCLPQAGATEGLVLHGGRDGRGHRPRPWL